MQLKLQMFGPKGLFNNFAHSKQWRVVPGGWNFDGVLFGPLKQEQCLTQPSDEIANTLIKVDVISEEGKVSVAGFGNLAIIEAAKLGFEFNWRRLRKSPDNGDIAYEITLTAF